MKSFKEYIMGFSLGSYSHLAPMASLGDYPPKGKQHRTRRAVGLTANYRGGKGVGTYKPMGSLNNEKNPRIPRKPGQKAGSKKHSDLYTDENPKGTIKGLGFAKVKDAVASVAKIKASGRSHAHKTQAAIAMEQRARVAGKLGAARVYRRFIEAQKKITAKKRQKK